MKYQHLKKWVITRVALYMLVLVIIGAGYVMLNMKQTDLANQRNDVLMQTSSLNDQLTTLQAKAAEIAEATKIWQQIPEKNKQGSGLKIDKVKLMLDEYGKRYQIQEMTIDLSTPAELEEPYKSPNAVTVSSKINLKFSSINDENILAFVDAILRDIPGYVKIQSFKVARQNDLSETVLTDIRKGLRPALVSGELSLEWRDLKVIVVEKEAKTDKPNAN